MQYVCVFKHITLDLFINQSLTDAIYGSVEKGFCGINNKFLIN